MNKDLVKDLGFRTLGTRLKRIADKMSHSARDMYKKLGMDIEPNWYLVLTLVKENDAVSIVEIARYLGFAHQSIVSMTNKMIKRGYLLSSKDENDLRRTVVRLTPKSEEILPEIEKIWNHGEEVIAELLDNNQELLKHLDVMEHRLNESSFGDRILGKL